MSLSNSQRQNIKNEISDLLCGSFRMKGHFADDRDFYIYSAFFNNEDDYWENIDNKQLDRKVLKIFQRYGGGMNRYDASSNEREIWWMMDERDC